MRDRIADEDGASRQASQPPANRLPDALDVAVKIDADDELGTRDGLCVLVALGASRPPRDRENARDLAQLRRTRLGHALGLVQRSPRRQGKHHVERILAKRRQKARTEAARHDHAQDGRGHDEDHDQYGEPQGKPQKRAIRRLHDADAKRLACACHRHARLASPIPAQQPRQGRRHHEREDQRRGEDGEIGEAERTEEIALKARQHEEGDEHERDNQRREGDARQDGSDGLGDRQVASPPNRLGENDGCIHDIPGRDGKAAKRHHVDAQAKRRKQQHGNRDRQRHRGQHHENRPHAEKRQHQNDHDDDHRITHDARAAVNGGADEVRLAIGVRVYGDALLANGLAERLQGAVKLPRDLGRIAARHLLDRQDHGFASLERGATAARRASHGDVRHIPQAKRARRALDNRRAGKRLQRVRPRDLPKRNLVSADVGEIAAAGHRPRVAHRLDDVGDRQPLGGETARRDGHAAFGKASAHDGDLADALHRKETRTQDELGQFAQLQQRGPAVLGGQRHEHDLAGDGNGRRDLDLDFGRQALAHTLKALEDVKARTGEIGAPVEVHPDEGQPAARTGAYRRDVRDAVQRRLERQRHALLYLLRRQAGRLRLENDARHGDVWEDIDGKALEEMNAQPRQRERGSQEEDRMMDNELQESVHNAP